MKTFGKMVEGLGVLAEQKISIADIEKKIGCV